MKHRIIFIFLIVSAIAVNAQDGQSSILKEGSDSLNFSKVTNKSAIDSLNKSALQEDSILGSYFYTVIFVLFILLMILVTGLHLYKKYILKQPSNSTLPIKILSRQNISPKQSVLIVNIEGTKYALGATDHSINLIKELGAASEEELKVRSAIPVNFGNLLNKITNKVN